MARETGTGGVLYEELNMGFEVDFLPVGDGEKSGDAITLRCEGVPFSWTGY